MRNHNLTTRVSHGRTAEETRAAHGPATHLNRRALAVMLAALTMLCARPALAQEATESVLKGAFVFNFMMFTEWPQDVLPSGAPLIACVVGDEPVAEALIDNVDGRLINGHSVVVMMRTENTVQGCHVLYVSSASASTITQTMTSVGNSPCLTISDGGEFVRTGGIVELFVEGGKMRFKVSLGSVKRSRIQLSSRLLSLAELVK